MLLSLHEGAWASWSNEAAISDDAERVIIEDDEDVRVITSLNSALEEPVPSPYCFVLSFSLLLPGGA